MNILIFGAGNFGEILYKWYEKQTNERVVGFLDNGSSRKLFDVNVYKPEKVREINYDQIVISIKDREQINSIKAQLFELGVAEQKINVLIDNVSLMVDVFSDYNRYDEKKDLRVNWIKELSRYFKMEHINGDVAECGVNRGEFAFYINKYFSDRKLFLFDTFNGFDHNDLDAENKIGNKAFVESEFNDKKVFSAADERIVMKRMLYPDKCVIRKGYFPDTAIGLDTNFAFVNLDMDLYKPMIAGLRVFYDRMVSGGVILMHDYFHPRLPGVKQAVMDFEKSITEKLNKFPIGDGCSIAIIK